MKKLNITKKQYDESKYFNNKYGSIKFVSESGKLFKTDKGVVLSLEASKKPFTMKEETEEVPPADEKPVTEDIDEVEELVDDVETSDADEEDTINKEEVTAALADIVDSIKAIADDNELEVPGLVPEDEDEDDLDDEDEDEDEYDLDDIDECDCKDGKCDCGKKLEKEGFLDMFKGKPKFKRGDKVQLKHAIGNLRGVWTVTNPDELGEVGLVNDRGQEMTSPARNLLAAECGKACECKTESAKRRARVKLVREAIAKRARIRKIKESIRRRAKARKVLESIKAKRAAKARKMMESKKVRASKRVARRAR